ncbi:MarR family transcriptional regulator [Methylobacterium sp. WL30]|jgi:DNA-binding MarR family transcriptional regulator|uniref:MarR family winged helix-turn-helix transcriptional regulator n=1 Tax=unclassified Methylobacterium TaxID=2615210 RepID=UPI0011CB0A82|nr:MULTISPECIES: MarR family transcriptional regulator [unclassified Methylobacterium]MCJ2074202.1 MarR family transcriptional regulator [Methylobacterium sp. E-016]TXM91775.1 MarR family transcriptional regulator [Methylobacterium sp. WL116]TXN41051.1 MarR family transcriptional regulator [Methylobacterium sp. WL93]TXN49502.1 MarR family transcriptional regulator [Methylobacterium sp. WL119]TXN69643.1 MarR family transcriptional regulator [Methylobacterium sp. WL30]
MDDRIADDRAGDREETDAAAAAARTWPLTERPGFLARRLHQIHVSLFSERCAAFRITPLQYSLLSLLRDLEEADQTTLANAVALDRTTTTGALKRLATRGLVSRSTSLADRRAQVCRITAEGKALHAAMEHAAHEAHALTISALAPKDQDLLVGLLRRAVAGHDHRRGHLDLG